VTNTVDPLAGSYFLEHLTDEMERGARAYFERIDALGGVEAAIEEGFFAREIGDASYQQQREIDASERFIVGVNAFQGEAPRVPLQLVDPGRRGPVGAPGARARRARRRRGPRRARRAAERRRRRPQHHARVHGLCAHAFCTLGEQMDVLRDVYGVYEEPVAV
jgi:methylmalonyl-CoA mutase, N-terminal domain